MHLLALILNFVAAAVVLTLGTNVAPAFGQPAVGLANEPIGPLPTDHPDAWLWSNLPASEKDRIARELGPGFVTQVQEQWIRVRTDGAPSTPLADLTTSGATEESEDFGFPDGVVDNDDLMFFLYALFEHADVFDLSECIEAREGAASVSLLTMDRFNASFSANFERALSVSRAFANSDAGATRPYGEVLRWSCRLALYTAVHQAPTVPAASDCPVRKVDLEFRHAITPDRTDIVIPGSTCVGLWRHQPGIPLLLSPFHFRVDSRNVCEDGTSRLSANWSINSNEIGLNSNSSQRVLAARFIAKCGSSAHLPEGATICQHRTAQARANVTVVHVGGCRTYLAGRVSANYPFMPGGPGLQDIGLTLNVVVGAFSLPATPQCGYVFALISGEHSSFPSFDARATLPGLSRNCFYQFVPAVLLPGLPPLGPLDNGTPFGAYMLQGIELVRVAPGC